jgi:hypothetical protein
MTDDLKAKMSKIVDLLLDGNGTRETLALTISVCTGVLKCMIVKAFPDRREYVRLSLLAVIDSMRKQIEEFQPEKEKEK